MSIIFFQSISKTYRKGFKATPVKAVQDLTCNISSGCITGFVGPNGAGKTTTMKMIMGLVKPSCGSISIRSTDASLPKAREKVAYVSEQPYFYRHLSVSESLRFTADLLGIPGADIKGEIKRVLETVELGGKENLRIREMSKGMQQRLNMANGLLGNPELLILDEPMSGLDPPARRLFRNLFKTLGKEGKTIFFSTHVLEDIEIVCDEVIVLDKGQLRYSGKVSTLLEQGYMGTELLVQDLPDQLVSQFEEKGWYVTGFENGSSQIFVPSVDKSFECQKTLNQHQIFCESVVKRTKPLETLLYGSTLETKS